MPEDDIKVKFRQENKKTRSTKTVVFQIKVNEVVYFFIFFVFVTTISFLDERQCLQTG